MTATHPESFAIRFTSCSLSYLLSLFARIVFSSATLSSISDFFPAPQIMVVVSLFAMIDFARPSSEIETFSSFIPSSSDITVPPVRIAISRSISLRLSPKPGALTASTLRTPLSLLSIIVVSASHSIFSAIITRSFFPDPTSSSSTGRNSFIFEIFLSVMSIGASLISATIFSVFDTI